MVPRFIPTLASLGIMHGPTPRKELKPPPHTPLPSFCGYPCWPATPAQRGALGQGRGEELLRVRVGVGDKDS